MKWDNRFNEKNRTFVTNWVYHEFKFFTNFCHELDQIFGEFYTKRFKAEKMQCNSIREIPL